MDYNALAEALIEKMHLLKKARPNKMVSEVMQGEAFVIQFLFNRKDSAQPGVISGHMGISSARVAAALNSLEKKGLITRRTSPADRRRVLVDLTEEGRETAQIQRSAMLSHMAWMLRLLGEEDAQEYVRIMGRLAELMAKHECPAHHVHPFGGRGKS